MIVRALQPPPPSLQTDAFPATAFSPAGLYRVSGHHTGEPYFGTSGANRFDAPAGQYGACYLGETMSVALAESVLHDEEPDKGVFKIPPSMLVNKYLLRFNGQPLRLLALMGALLKRLGGSADLAGTGDYGLTQQWALAVFHNPLDYDGILYMSRHLNNKRAVVLFDRAGNKINMRSAVPLISAPGFATAARTLGIQGG